MANDPDDPPYEVKCPKCGELMVRKQNSRTLQPFWGCSAWPTCDGTRPVDGDAKGASEDDDLPSSRMRSRDRQRWRE
jgi:ssDNA-binding Zn-finger/Zn-ribbon topoisomerase 1